jgi:hypothetical protein
MTSKWLARLEDFESRGIHEIADISQNSTGTAVVEIENTLTNSSDEIEESRSVHIKEAADMYKKKGWIRIHSAYLGKDIYLKKNKWKKVPNPELASYTEREIQALRGLSKDELLTLHDAKVIFQGTISND